jgi:hypothetical protein
MWFIKKSCRPLARWTAIGLVWFGVFAHAFAQTKPPSTAKKTSPSPAVPNPDTAIIDRLTLSNQDLLDLLKKQQAVLEDIQFDRRLQNRQISSLEERLEDTLEENAKLQAQVARLETALATPPSAAAPSAASAPAAVVTPSAPPPAPPTPQSYLPPPEPEGAPGTKTWHRLFTVSGSDGKNTDVFHIQSRTWRVLWHNQDRPGSAYVNTSALFISAFPKDDNVPQKVCSKLGSGGDETELEGPGNFYLKIEASGGAWEAAVEDFR